MKPDIPSPNHVEYLLVSFPKKFRRLHNTDSTLTIPSISDSASWVYPLVSLLCEISEGLFPCRWVSSHFSLTVFQQCSIVLANIETERSNLSETWVMTVFSSDSFRPISWENLIRMGFTPFSKISLDASVMMTSSAYLTRLTVRLYATLLRVACLNPEIAVSMPSRVTLARIGYMIPSCGVHLLLNTRVRDNFSR